MNRVDRLTGTLLLLQSHRSITVTDIASHWEISERTVYRDLAALSEAGVPIYFEAGIGYRLMDGYEMSPVMLSVQEAMAVFMSGEIAEKLADISLKESLKSALIKIRSVLPEEQQAQLERFKDSVGVWLQDKYQTNDATSLIPLHRAVVERKCIAISYTRRNSKEATKRIVEPQAVIFYAGHWHLVAWCRLRKDYRDFRMDRIDN
jgi:predicted DNA-binding transcriptional regulator YafY